MSMRSKMVDEKDEFPVKVGDDIYGPISLERLTTDLKNGNLTNQARVWDGEDWVPITIVVGEEIWDGDGWNEKYLGEEKLDGTPLPTTSAWKDVIREGRWIMIYGDHLVIEGGTVNAKDMGRIIEGEPLSGGIPLPKLLNVCFTETDRGIKVEASSFHKMYETYALECCISKDDSEELMKELMDAKVRIRSN